MPELTISGAADQTQVQSTPEQPISFSSEQYETLRDLAQRQNIDLSDAVGQAIDIAKMVLDISENKGERLLVQKGSQLRELTLG